LQSTNEETLMTARKKSPASDLGPVELELFHNRFMAVAEEMGVVLEQSGFSPNIKERRDFSCALFDRNGDMAAHAAHIPVHLGSTPLSVRAAIDAVPMGPGDIVILNDPYAGGTHLPDVTLVAPVYLDGYDRPFAYVADRAHHADIGGSSPGSMPLATGIHEEGFRLPPVHLLRGGDWVRETRELFLANTRVPEERLGDLDAQVAALRVGAARTRELAERFGASTVENAMGAVQDYAQRLVTALLAKLPAGKHQAEDVLDDDGYGTRDIALRVALQRQGRGARSHLQVDFRGSDSQCRGPMNANLAITTSAVFYVIACVAGREVPANSGILRAVSILTTPGSIVDCTFPSAVAAGNVETSQRIVDVLLRAFAKILPEKIPAASYGSMNNTALGGYDQDRERWFSYYETIAGGAGAGPTRDGASAIQTHMTNTLNTPIESLEAYYPLRVHRYGLRKNSGGKGKNRGGDGIVREIEVLGEAKLTLLTERRRHAPWGLAGGDAAKRGRNTLVRNGRKSELPAKCSIELQAGDHVIIETPGGGGWGKIKTRAAKTRC
jgi:N-methylhydantoinase B